MKNLQKEKNIENTNKQKNNQENENNNAKNQINTIPSKIKIDNHFNTENLSKSSEHEKENFEIINNSSQTQNSKKSKNNSSSGSNNNEREKSNPCYEETYSKDDTINFQHTGKKIIKKIKK